MKIRSFHKLPLILSALCLPASLVSAATIYDLTRLSADRITGEGQASATLGYTENTTTEDTIGGTGSNTSQTRRSYNLVYGYQLPTLSAGQSIESFTFTFDVTQYKNDGGDDFDLDVYLLDADPTDTGTTYFYGLTGETAVDPNQDLIGSYTAAATLTDSASTTVPDTGISFTVNSGAALTTLQSFYTGTTPNQSEVYLRFNLGAGHSALDLDRYRIDTAGTDSFEITAVPEPSSLALIGLTGLGLMLRRRR